MIRPEDRLDASFRSWLFLVPAFRNDDFTGERLSDYPDGVPDFRLFKFLAEWIRQQDVPQIGFLIEQLLEKARM